MSQIHIVIADPTRPHYMEAAREILSEHGWTVSFPASGDEADLLALAPACTILITRKRPIPAAFFEQAQRLRAIFHIGTTPDKALVAHAEERGIAFRPVPNPGNIAVAEQAMALMLGISRHVVRGHLGTVSGEYRERGLTPVVTSETQIAYQWLNIEGVSLLYGKTLGIVGFGDIGQAVARMANGFGMNVLYYRRQRLTEAEEQALNVTYCDLDEMIPVVDYLTLHVPHTAATDKLISGERIRAMKKGAYLINVCRGGVVDEMAMVEALQDGHLAGAGLDVFVEEPVPYDHPLLKLDNVCLSPHIGSAPARGISDALKLIKPQLEQLLAN